MKKLLMNQQGQLRNGYWILLFIGLIALTRPLYSFIKSTLTDAGVGELWLEPLSVILILAVTWLCCWLRKESLSKAGIEFNFRAFRLLQAGLLFGLIQMAIIVAVMWITGSVSFELNINRSLDVLLVGFYVFLFAAIMEEMLFRGFLFQRLMDGIGIWPAQIGMALLFAIGHWSNPEMEGPTLIWASIDIGLGAILWGLALIRTGSLALPIGMHLGWNWSQGNLFGFAVSGHGHEGWLQPTVTNNPEWLTGGAFGPEATVVAVVVDLLAIALLLRWKGSQTIQLTGRPSLA